MDKPEKLLRYQYIRRLAERKDEEGNPVPFRLEYISKKHGELLVGERVITTSVEVKKKKRNVKFLDSGETRTIHDVLIYKINDTRIIVS